MKLNVVFDDTEPESILYFEKEVYINAKSPDQVQALLIDEQLKLENLEERKSASKVIDDYDIEVSSEERETDLAIIKVIEQALERSLTLNDFTHYEINFENFGMLSYYVKFLESLKGNILLNVSNFSKKDINELKKISFQSEPQIKYRLNIGLVSLSEFIETMEIIGTMETTIARFSLSEIEQQMLLFDLIRERIYKASNLAEKSSSRSLNRVLKEEEIVCAGYANIFAAVSNHLDIPTFVKTYISKKDETIGHATNVSYVYDSVYDLFLTLECDLTMNRKRSKEDNTWINDYTYFAQSEAFATKQKEERYYVAQSLTNDLEEQYKRYLYLLDNCFSSFCLNIVIKRIVEIAIQIFKYLNQKDKVEALDAFLPEISPNAKINPKKIEDLYTEIKKITQKSIPVETFIQMLYRVRRIEHSLDPKKYPLDFELIEKIVNDKYQLDKLLLKVIQAKEKVESLDVLKYIPKNKKNKIKYDTKMMEMLYQLRKLEANKSQEKGLTNK